jgi:hypothetical protein
MRLRLFLIVASAVGIVVACYSPTEVELAVTTDALCDKDKTETQILLSGVDHAVGTAYGCEEPVLDVGKVGSFYVSPLGSRDAHVEVTVVHTTNRAATGDAENCLHDDRIKGNCIIARRAFAFQPHKTGYVNVRLYAQCIGVTECLPGSTCEPTTEGSGHVCAPSETAVHDSACPDCTSDAEAPFVDASRDADKEVGIGTNDSGAPAPCVALDGGVITQLTSTPAGQIYYDGITQKLVYETANGEAVALRVDGTTPPVVLYARTADPMTEVRGIATFGGDAYVATATALSKYDLKTEKRIGQPEPVPVSNIQGIAANATNVFVISSSGGIVRFTSASLAGSGKVFPSLTGIAISANASRVFYATATSIEAVFPDGGSAGISTAVANAAELAAPQGFAGTYFRTPSTVGLSNSPLRQGATPVYLATGKDAPYWIDRGGNTPDAIMTLAGGKLTTLATSIPSATGIAVSDSCIYYVAANQGAGGGALPSVLRARGL